MLYDPKTATAVDKQDVVETIAHELAHQWTGNLGSFFFNFSWLYFELHSLSFLSDYGMVERHLAEWRLRYLLPVLWNWFSKPFFILSNKFKFKGIYISPINWLNFRLNQRLRKVSGSWSTRFTMSLSSIRCPLPGQSTFQSVHHPRV